MEISEQDWEVIRRLRQDGCVVVIFLPEEIRDASSEDVEDRMTEAGWQVIETNYKGKRQWKLKQ